MTTQSIRAALETKLATLTPALPTAWENADFTPQDGVPFQQVTVLFARPDNPSFGDNFYRQSGYMQVSLQWPLYQGSGDAADRADAIRATFHRGLSLEADDVEVTIGQTPEISAGSVQGDRYVVPVRVYFYANVFMEN